MSLTEAYYHVFGAARSRESHNHQILISCKLQQQEHGTIYGRFQVIVVLQTPISVCHSNGRGRTCAT